MATNLLLFVMTAISFVMTAVLLAQTIMLRAAFREIGRLEDIGNCDWDWIIKMCDKNLAGHDHPNGLPVRPERLRRKAGFWGFMLGR
jgi:hypothetical protein